MSYVTARDKLIDLLEASTPTTSGIAGLPNVFRHDAKASDLLPPSPRRFYLRFSDGAGAGGEVGGFYTNGRRTRTKTMELVIAYQRMTDDALLDQAMAEDIATLTDALLASENWDPVNSTIVQVTQAGNTVFPHTKEILDDVYLSRLRFALEHY